MADQHGLEESDYYTEAEQAQMLAEQQAETAEAMVNQLAYILYGDA